MVRSRPPQLKVSTSAIPHQQTVFRKRPEISRNSCGAAIKRILRINNVCAYAPNEEWGALWLVVQLSYHVIKYVFWTRTEESLRKLVAFKIDDRFLRQVDSICEQIDCSRTAFIKRCLHYYIGMSELQLTAVDREVIQRVDRGLQKIPVGNPGHQYGAR
jgi:hypothetical protein